MVRGLPGFLGPMLRVLPANLQAGWWMPWVVGDTWELSMHRIVGPLQEPGCFCTGIGVGDSKKTKEQASALGVGRGTDG